MPECRVCKQQIDKEHEDWIMPKKNQYYHRKCYNDWKNSLPDPDDRQGYEDLIFNYIGTEKGFEYNYFKCIAQINKLLKQGKTLKGILFTLKYFYDVKKGDWTKGYGGIGIVEYVYEEAAAYWYKREKKEKGIVAGIEEQMRIAYQQKQKTIHLQTKARSIKDSIAVDISEIEEMEDEE